MTNKDLLLGCSVFFGLALLNAWIALVLIYSNSEQPAGWAFMVSTMLFFNSGLNFIVNWWPKK